MAESAASKETKPAAREPAGTKSEKSGSESAAEGMSFEELEPKAPPGALSPVGATVTAVEVFPDEVDEVGDAGELSITTGVDYEADDVEPFEGEPVTSLQAAGGPGGAVVAINGESYVFSAGQLGVLARLVSQAAAAAS